MSKELIEKYAVLDFPGSPKMQDFIKKSTFDVFVFDDGKMLAIEKESIRTSFCFGYGFCGRSSKEDEDRANKEAEHARTSEDYFIEANTGSIKRTLRALKFGKFSEDIERNLKTFEVCRYSVNFRADFEFGTRPEDLRLPKDESCRELTENEKKKLIDIYERLLENKIKRCQTWWKRYGSEYIRSWSYLSD